MKKFISVLLLSSLLPQICYAQQSAPSQTIDIPIPQLSEGEKDPGEAISPMKRLQKAPFTGVLLSPAAVAKVIVELSTIGQKIEIEVKKVKEEQEAVCVKKVSDTENRLGTDKRVIEARLNSSISDYNSLNKQYKKLKEDHESEWNPETWIGIGAAGGIAVTILTAFAISQATK